MIINSSKIIKKKTKNVEEKTTKKCLSKTCQGNLEIKINKTENPDNNNENNEERTYYCNLCRQYWCIKCEKLRHSGKECE